MEWPFNDPCFDDEELDEVLRYGIRESEVQLRICGTEGVAHSSWTLDSEETWMKWLSEDNFSLRGRRRPGLGVILASRAVEKHNKIHNSSILEYLPFSRDVFGRIITTFPLHGDTLRILNRSGHAVFESMDLRGNPSGAIFYCCRTTSKYAGDIAISSVFYPNSGFTAAVCLGCSKPIADNITSRIKTAENTTSHPLLIIGFLVEIERERHIQLVDSQVDQLLGRVYALSCPEQISATSSMRTDHYSLESWIMISELRDELEAWKVRLSQMVTHIDELERDVFSEQHLNLSSDSFQSTSSDTEVEILPAGDLAHDEKEARLHHGSSDGADWKKHGRHSGRRIRTRLTEIMHEYDRNIRRCTIFIDGLVLATQMSWNQIGYQDTQTNLRIASDMKRDSSQMKSVSLLTMIFLPAMFVSSVFSMTFFNWHPDTGEDVISSYMWIYPVVVVAVTAAVLAVWYIYSKKRKTTPESASPV